MRTSLTEIAAIEQVLQGSAEPEESLLLQARAILDSTLAENISAQEQSYHLLRQYGRKQLKAELEAIHQKLFTQSQYSLFAKKIKALFGKE